MATVISAENSIMAYMDATTLKSIMNDDAQ